MRSLLHTFRTALAVLAAVVVLTGCDSTENERTDAELIVGAWTAVALQDDSGDLTDRLTAGGELTVDFDATRYTLAFDAVGDGEDTALTGTYTLQEELGRLTLRATLSGQDVTLPMSYAFQSEDRVELRIDEQFRFIFTAVLGADAPTFDGDVTLVFARD